MMETSELTQMLWSQLQALPLYLAWLAGLVVAIVTWRRHPAVSLIASIAFVVLLALTFATRVLNIWLARFLIGTGWTADQIGIFYGVYGLVFAVIEALAWVLVIVAMFRWRAGAPNAEPPPFQSSPADAARDGS